jgi:ATP synthase protein I
MPPRLGRQRGRTIQSLGALSAAGLSFVLAVLMGAGAGYFVDSWLGSSPICFLLGFACGVAAGMINVFRAASASSNLKDRN